jgi:DNA-binding MarR family transcriptional regulator
VHCVKEGVVAEVIRLPAARRGNLITLFRRAAHAMSSELIVRLAALGYDDMRPADGRVFENLDPGGSRVTELAVRAQMTQQSMSELVAGLEARGYVERVPDPTDRRARTVRLTPRGRAMLRAALPIIDEIDTVWLRRMGLPEGPELRSALRRALDANGSH